jgi:hypothetical protein
MSKIKTVIGVALAVVWGAIFLVLPAYAFVDDGTASTNHNGSAESKSTANATGRGVATFGMNFSASANTTGDFDHNGMMQNIFGGQSDSREYYYRPVK